ncbi:MAG: amidohydrolase [Prolixibacteraceae bacterium]|jgi:omega-amidase|nr:amidohydrolase [Prolixibacteraceae bacterium]MBT7000714.1 amidohydrolase [Prolixibacteraceae bacterium]MBT7395302.1 amidohydrolase [Prolixibacteraceae bacterium]
MQNLKITIIQPDIIWENPKGNLEKYSQLIDNIENTDVIILPEMFTTGFSMHPENLKESMDGISVNWMKKVAANKNASVVGSLIIEENKQIFNRALWVFPNGKMEKYDKRHLYTMGQEHLHYSPGKDKLIVEFRGWKFCPLICYDLRFPVWSRNQENYDVLIYMANWPSPRHHVWKNLLVARAVENQSYCFGVNRTRTDGTGLKYLGDSALVSPKGKADFMGENESVRTFETSYSELHNFRKSFPLLEDRDEFQIEK